MLRCLEKLAMRESLPHGVRATIPAREFPVVS
jgi:hypothetical protein